MTKIHPLSPPSWLFLVQGTINFHLNYCNILNNIFPVLPGSPTTKQPRRPFNKSIELYHSPAKCPRTVLHTRKNEISSQCLIRPHYFSDAFSTSLLHSSMAMTPPCCFMHRSAFCHLRVFALTVSFSWNALTLHMYILNAYSLFTSSLKHRLVNEASTHWLP